jgi:hypothetical protein
MKFEKELNFFGIAIITKQATKMRHNIFTTISSFFCSTTPFKINEPQQKEFLEDLALVIIKNHLLMQFVESVWLKTFAMDLCPRLLFLSKKQFSQEFCLNWWKNASRNMFYHCWGILSLQQV